MTEPVNAESQHVVANADQPDAAGAKSINELSEFKKQALNGLWKNNPALVQALGLCPLLAVSNTLVNALALGLATWCVLLFSNVAIASLRHFVPVTMRLPVFVVIIASLVTAVEYLLQAFSFPLYMTLGIFLPLITTNCLILGRAEALARKSSVLQSFQDAFWMGLGFLWVLALLGFVRELLAQGTMFADMQWLLGSSAASWQIELNSLAGSGFLLAALPPGAFLVLAAMIAAKNALERSK
ncbi:MAG: electron transport complex subunit E [Pseudomonadota bacterium]|nr:electron transport complex subunit E [Pseudomonadota bacterium]